MILSLSSLFSNDVRIQGMLLVLCIPLGSLLLLTRLFAELALRNLVLDAPSLLRINDLGPVVRLSGGGRALVFLGAAAAC
jgi:hypothetical protein